ncbi:MAG: HYR domain-containing protein, partial [Proteobacteria bacterium]
QNPSLSQTQNGRLTGGVDANGIPTIVNGGQGIGTSKNANIDCHCQAGIDKTAPSITCPANISTNATSASGAVVNYTTPVGADDCSTTTVRTAGLASGATFPMVVIGAALSTTGSSVQLRARRAAMRKAGRP